MSQIPRRRASLLLTAITALGYFSIVSESNPLDYFRVAGLTYINAPALLSWRPWLLAHAEWLDGALVRTMRRTHTKAFETAIGVQQRAPGPYYEHRIRYSMRRKANRTTTYSRKLHESTEAQGAHVEDLESWQDIVETAEASWTRITQQQSGYALRLAT